MALPKDQAGGREDKSESELRALKKDLQKDIQDLQKETVLWRKRLQKCSQTLISLETLLDDGQMQELEKRCIRLNRQNQELEKKISETQEREKALLLDQFVKLQEDLREIRNCEPYGDLFKKIAGSLQILIGLEESMDWLTDEKRDYYMWDRVVQPMIRAIEDACGTYEGGELVIHSQQSGQYDKTIENKIEEAKKMDREGLKQWIEEEKSRKAQGKILRQERKIIRDLADEIIRPIEELWESKVEGRFDWEQERNKNIPVRLAIAAKNILKCNGVCPMFASDKRLEGCPQRRRFFTPLKENAIRYPGLLIEFGGKWEILGEHLGMDLWEEEETGR